MIFYFTATGNSKYAAEKLQAAFGGSMEDIAVAVRNGSLKYRIPEGETLFFVFPVYYYDVPKIVREFIEKADFEGEDTPVCAVGTCGSSSGRCDRTMARLIKAKGMNFKAFYQVVMPENYLAMFRVPLPEEQIMILRRSDRELNDIVDDIKFGFRMGRKSGLAGRTGSALAQIVYRNGRPTKKFYADDSCISCGICQTLCVFDVIRIAGDGKPAWTKDRCAHCMACISRCPKQAIQYGNGTKKKVRFINPSLK